MIPDEKIIKLWGLLEYKPRWSLSLQGWLLLLLSCLVIFGYAVTHVQGFLAPRVPIRADTLLIEGWVSDWVIPEAIEEFNRGDYRYIITTGIPFHKGFYLSEYQNQAELMCATLVKLGIDRGRIIPVSIPAVEVNRTAAMAMAVRKRILQDNLEIKAVNIYSFDVHTRRSYFIYQRVLKPEIKVGAIAHPNTSYDPDRWWTTSIGFRGVIEEAIAYFYARFIWPFQS
jgi:hypothetical protein